MTDSSLEEVLVVCPITKALEWALDKACLLSLERDRLPFNHPSQDEPSRPSADLSEGLLTYLTSLVSQGEKGTDGISLLGIEEYGRVAHAHSMFCDSAGDYSEPDLWGVLAPLPDKSTPNYIKIMPLHLAASYSFLAVSRKEFDSDLAGLSTEGEYLKDLAQ